MSKTRFILATQRRVLAGALLGCLLITASTASADGNFSEADFHMTGGRFAEAGSAYRRAFAETGDIEFLKKAGQAFLALGVHGRKDAILSFELYRKNAKGKRYEEASRLLKQAQALKEAPPPPVAAAVEPAPEQSAVRAPAIGAVVPSAPADPAAPTAPAEAPPPAATPEDDELPPAEPIESMGSMRWSPSLGFVQPSDPVPAKSAQPATKDESSSGLAIPKILELDLGYVAWYFGIGAVTLNPINDGVTDDDTALTVFEGETGLRAEFRTMTKLLSWWFDVGFAGLAGKRSQTEPVDTGVALSVESFRMSGRVGLDFHPLEHVAVGPFGGYRMDLYQANLTSGNGTGELTDNGFENDSGVLYGVHVVLRTKERPEAPSLLYFEPMLARRHGQLIGLYAGAEAGLNIGKGYLRAWYESRLSADGDFTYSRTASADAEAPTLSHAFALAMPVEQRVGVGVMLTF